MPLKPPPLQAMISNDAGRFTRLWQLWIDSIRLLVVGLRDDGSIQPASLADADAVNESIYYSTTQSKLVYKDNLGVVNNLY